MSDEADAAQKRQAELDADSLEAQRRRAALDRPGADLCADCGDEIPPERRSALPSATRCVNCQAFAERIGRIPNHAQ